MNRGITLSREVYSIYGVSPEIAAYGMAKYSRSSLSLKDSLKELSQQRAEQFLDTFYFQYGHSSIADLAHVAMAIENISVLAALYIVDEPLWDGQERSTRYQDFNKTKYYLPDQTNDEYVLISDEMFKTYNMQTIDVQKRLENLYAKPADMDQDYYHRTMRARAFDISRYWLPLGTNTSLGQITNARTLERQISRLLSHELNELKIIAEEMKVSVKNNPPVILDETNSGPLLPTLAKHIGPNDNYIQTKQELKSIASEVLEGIKPIYKFGVELCQQEDAKLHACAKLLYSSSNLSYNQISEHLKTRNENELNEILHVAFKNRGKYDLWLRELQSQPLVFDITMDIGSFRDLNRHRKVNKILQELSGNAGFAIPFILEDTDYQENYKKQMNKHFESVRSYMRRGNPDWVYLLPMGALCRSLHQMDFNEAAYVIELRTGSAGHFSYREIAYQMYEVLEQKHSDFAKYIRVTNPREVYNPFQR